MQGGTLILCDWCNVAYHIDCLPSLKEVDLSLYWACPVCLTEAAEARNKARQAALPGSGVAPSVVALDGSEQDVQARNRRKHRASRRERDARPGEEEGMVLKPGTQKRVLD